MQHKEIPTELIKLIDIDENIRNTMRWLVRMHPCISTVWCCEGSESETDKPYIYILVCDLRDLDNIRRDIKPYAEI
ncbi:hypothetical protein LCGC14_2679090, partial [marine sediment metagenome]